MVLLDDVFMALEAQQHAHRNLTANVNSFTERINNLEEAGGGGGGGGDFTQLDSSHSAFISNKPIITTSSSKTVVGAGVAANAEGNVTAFGKDSGKQAHNGHLCLGEQSGELGRTMAISIGYKARAINVNSTVISGGSAELTSSENDAFYMERLRTVDPIGHTDAANMKINMYNTSTKEIFNVHNLLVPGNCKIIGTVQFGTDNSAAKISINSTGAIGFGSNAQFGVAGTVLLSRAETLTPAWGVLPYSSLSGRPNLAAYATLASPAFTGAPTINGADFPKSKVYGTCYLGHNAYVNIAGNFTGQYANVNDGRWVQDFTPSHNTLFNLSSGQGLIRFPRAGVYQINVSIRILAAAEVFYISLDLDTGNGTYTQYSTVGHQGQGGDDAYVVTLTANPIINVTNTTTNMRIMARAHQGNPRRIEPQVNGNNSYQKSSIISVHNVD